MKCLVRINLLVVCLVLAATWKTYATAAGNVGCLFGSDLCENDEECFDDNAFGRCQSEFDSDSFLYRHSLGSETMKLLKEEMSRLFVGGYRWDHDYTQCVVQNILYAQRHKVSYDPGLCSRILRMTLPEVPGELLAELEEADPNELAVIKFNPNRGEDENLIFAAENFNPPAEDEPEPREGGSQITGRETFREKKKMSDLGSPGDSGVGSRDDRGRDPLLRRFMEVASDTQKLFDVSLEDLSSGNEFPLIKTELSSDMEQRPIFTESGMEWVPAKEDTNLDSKKSSEKSDYPHSNLEDNNIEPHMSNAMSYEHMKEGGEPQMSTSVGRHSDKDENEDELSRANVDSDSTEEGHYRNIGDEPVDVDDTNFRWNWRHWEQQPDQDYKAVERGNRLDKFGYKNTERRIRPTTGGQYVQRSEENDYLEDSLHAVLPTGGEAILPTFQRPMRYDIKKPGPAYFYHDDEDGVSYEDYEIPRQTENQQNNMLSSLMGASQIGQLQDIISDSNRSPKFTTSGAEDVRDDERLKEIIHLKYLQPMPSDVLKTSTDSTTKVTGGETKRTYHKIPSTQPEVIEGFLGKTPANYDQTDDVRRTGEGHVGRYDSVDSTHVYITFDESSISMQESQKFLRYFEKLLGLPRGTFSNLKLDGNQIDFKVNLNIQDVNASDVAAKAEEYRNELKDGTHLNVASAGIGDKVKLAAVDVKNERKFFILTFVLCGGVVGILLTVAVAYVVRRHARSKEKLQNISQPDTEASQDYQDLCRQRMASKTNEGTESFHAAFSPKKARSISQGEGQVSTSSHSSTSSWNEEPVTSNMDISTGHIILSYMEDHLKNKDRLNREWEALCTYEAEPCATTAATDTQNVKKNRYPDVLPYDHSRVTLNEVANVSGSDYINACSITDHDPRNPAYIATQGPLPHTAADFWQMIWEQGSVVMVMLTRLMENGVAMCHRHWPEEGSEVYHIYEVHLVSEHIWCDDYLVRSFYLKNLKTGETRTVTQFHFLSWPDNGVPNSTKALLEFRRKVNKSYRGRSCPIVVHCSDGIGRTGTYILIDMVLNRMSKGAKEIDIAATLEHVRDQRLGMVKTKAQFEFVLMAIAEEVHAILKALSQ